MLRFNHFQSSQRMGFAVRKRSTVCSPQLGPHLLLRRAIRTAGIYAARPFRVMHTRANICEMVASNIQFRGLMPRGPKRAARRERMSAAFYAPPLVTDARSHIYQNAGNMARFETCSSRLECSLLKLMLKWLHQINPSERTSFSPSVILRIEREQLKRKIVWIICELVIKCIFWSLYTALLRLKKKHEQVKPIKKLYGCARKRFVLTYYYQGILF